uniref:Retinoblastoma-associated protein B-box domain-containing protein n=1 Tax=Periophthalmus magnuspinnatus TaxID=409849 RepID=A0A3B3ZD94_9GOBI
LMDRNLDQLLMCAIYVIAKVTKEDKSFQNIMKCYRTQPQANSNVYRNVLISERTSQDQTVIIYDTHGSLCYNFTSTTTTMIISSTTPNSEEEERGDLIHFYNNVYIKQMRHFALRFSPSSGSAVVSSLMFILLCLFK